MQLDIIASTKVKEVTRPRASGKPVNTHVISAPKSPKPDYERMKRLVHPQQATGEAEHKTA